jgi:serine/threonine protein kinase
MQQLEVFGCRFDLPGHYKLIKPIGQGACGIVCAVEDTTTGAHMALKQIPRVFNNLTETKRTLREIRLLRCLRHRNIVSLIHVLPPVSPADFNEIYLASELLDTDLNQIINSAQPLTDEHIQYFMWQLLCGKHRQRNSLDAVAHRLMCYHPHSG